MIVGAVSSAICPCGFTAEYLYLGGGMANYETYDGEAALCQRCGTLSVRNTRSPRPRCPQCRGPVRFYTEPEMHIDSPEADDWPDGAQLFLCPSCRQMTMRFEAIGTWD